jgi:hypothetical protein
MNFDENQIKMILLEWFAVQFYFLQAEAQLKGSRLYWQKGKSYIFIHLNYWGNLFDKFLKPLSNSNLLLLVDTLSNYEMRIHIVEIELLKRIGVFDAFKLLNSLAANQYKSSTLIQKLCNEF